MPAFTRGGFGSVRSVAHGTGAQLAASVIHAGEE